MKGVLALGLLLVTSAPIAAVDVVPSPRDAEALLAHPISPGVIALLVNRGGDHRVVELISTALRDTRPQVRSMAARFVGIRKVTHLEPVVREALRGETDLFAAREQVRALGILGAGPSDPDLLDAARRLDHRIAWVVTETLVRHHRVGGLRTYLDDLRTLAPARSLLEWVIEEGTRLDPGARHELGLEFLEASDAEGWRSLLATGDEDGYPIDRDLLLSALRHADPTIRDSTVWVLIARLPGNAPANPGEWLAAVDEGQTKGDRATENPEAAFGRRVLGRILGRPSEDDEAWALFLRDAPSSRLDSWHVAGAAASYLMKKELKSLQKRYKQRYGLALPGRPKRSLPPPPSIGSAIRVVSDYPRGLVPDLIRVTGCQAPVGAPALVEADVTYGADGRPIMVKLLSRPPGDACLDLATGLLAASLPPSRQLPKPEAVERLVLFVEKGWLQTLDELSYEDTPGYITAPGEQPAVTAPKRIRFVKPVYPEEARQARAEGKVIMELVATAEGIVKGLHVLKVTHTAFYRSALWAVARWRYEPARIHGRPVPVFLTVIVEFNLK